MNNQFEPSDSSERARHLRPVWMVLSVFFVASLVVNYFEWNGRLETSDRILNPISMLLLSLTFALQLKGALRNVFLALVMVLVVVSTVMIFSR